MSLPSFAQTFSAGKDWMNNTLPPIMAGRKRTNEEIKKEQDDDLFSSSSSPAPAPSQTLINPHSSSPHAHGPSAKKRRVTLSGSAPHPLRIDVPDSAPGQQSQQHNTPISPVVMGLNIPHEQVVQVRSMLSVKQKQKALIEQRRGSVAGVMSPIEGPGVRNLPVKDSSSLSATAITTGKDAVASAVSNSNTTPKPNSTRSPAPTRRSAVSSPPAPPTAAPTTPATIQHQTPSSSQSAAPPGTQSGPSSSQAPSTNVNAPGPSTSASSATPIAAHSLPPPPISFATRRAQHQRAAQLQAGSQPGTPTSAANSTSSPAASGRKKALKPAPADILISPRDDVALGIARTPNTANNLYQQPRGQPGGTLPPGRGLLSGHARHLAHTSGHPAIQSAPPGQNTFFPPGRDGRFPVPSIAHHATRNTTDGAAGGMAIPRLPVVLNQPEVRRVASNVPPTPTRLSMQSSMMNQTTASSSANNSAGSNGSNSNGQPGPQRSPPGGSIPSIPISASLIPLIPPTPTHFGFAHTQIGVQGQLASSRSGPSNHAQAKPPAATAAPSASTSPGNIKSAGSASNPADKESFLKPFELFYDALNDSKQLKAWLQDQLVRSGGLLKELRDVKDGSGLSGSPSGPDKAIAGPSSGQNPNGSVTIPVDELERMIERTVERRMGDARAELSMLRRRIDELEGERNRERERDRDREFGPHIPHSGHRERDIHAHTSMQRRGSVDLPPMRSSGYGYQHGAHATGMSGHSHGLMPNGVPPPPMPPQPSIGTSGGGGATHGVHEGSNTLPSLPSMSIAPPGPSHSHSYPYYERDRERDGRYAPPSGPGVAGPTGSGGSGRPELLRRLSSPGSGWPRSSNAASNVAPSGAYRDREREREEYDRRLPSVSLGGPGVAGGGDRDREKDWERDMRDREWEREMVEKERERDLEWERERELREREWDARGDRDKERDREIGRDDLAYRERERDPQRERDWERNRDEKERLPPSLSRHNSSGREDERQRDADKDGRERERTTREQDEGDDVRMREEEEEDE